MTELDFLPPGDEMFSDDINARTYNYGDVTSGADEAGAFDPNAIPEEMVGLTDLDLRLPRIAGYDGLDAWPPEVGGPVLTRKIISSERVAKLAPRLAKRLAEWAFDQRIVLTSSEGPVDDPGSAVHVFHETRPAVAGVIAARLSERDRIQLVQVARQIAAPTQVQVAATSLGGSAYIIAFTDDPAGADAVLSHFGNAHGTPTSGALHTRRVPNAAPIGASTPIPTVVASYAARLKQSGSGFFVTPAERVKSGRNIPGVIIRYAGLTGAAKSGNHAEVTQLLRTFRQTAREHAREARARAVVIGPNMAGGDASVFIGFTRAHLGILTPALARTAGFAEELWGVSGLEELWDPATDESPHHPDGVYGYDDGGQFWANFRRELAGESAGRRAFAQSHGARVPGGEVGDLDESGKMFEKGWLKKIFQPKKHQECEDEDEGEKPKSKKSKSKSKKMAESDDGKAECSDESGYLMDVPGGYPPGGGYVPSYGAPYAPPAPVYPTYGQPQQVPYGAPAYPPQGYQGYAAPPYQGPGYAPITSYGNPYDNAPEIVVLENDGTPSYEAAAPTPDTAAYAQQYVDYMRQSAACAADPTAASSCTATPTTSTSTASQSQTSQTSQQPSLAQRKQLQAIRKTQSTRKLGFTRLFGGANLARARVHGLSGNANVGAAAQAFAEAAVHEGQEDRTVTIDPGNGTTARVLIRYSVPHERISENLRRTAHALASRYKSVASLMRRGDAAVLVTFRKYAAVHGLDDIVTDGAHNPVQAITEATQEIIETIQRDGGEVAGYRMFPGPHGTACSEINISAPSGITEHQLDMVQREATEIGDRYGLDVGLRAMGGGIICIGLASPSARNVLAVSHGVDDGI